MSVYTDHAAALSSLRDELGVDCPVIVWQTLTIKVLPGGVRLKSSNSLGGLALESDFQFSCIAADFNGTLPASNQSLTYRGQSLKIESVTVAAGGLQLRINANHSAQRL